MQSGDRVIQGATFVHMYKTGDQVARSGQDPCAICDDDSIGERGDQERGDQGQLWLTEDDQGHSEGDIVG